MIKNIGKLALLIAICAMLKFSLSSNTIVEVIHVDEIEQNSNEILKPFFAFNTSIVKFTPTLGKSFIGFKYLYFFWFCWYKILC